MSKVDNVQSQAQSEAFIPNPSRQSEHAPTNVDVLKQPPPESSRTRWTRRSIIFSFWAIAVLLGFPTWWWTTNVYRAGLPLQSMSDWADGKVCSPVFPLRIIFDTPALRHPEAEHLLDVTQHALDDLNDFSAHHLRLSLADTASDDLPVSSADAILGSDLHDTATLLQSGVERPALVVKLELTDGISAPSACLRPHSHHLDVHYASNMIPPLSSTSCVLGTFIASQLRDVFAEEQAILGQLMTSQNPGSASRRLANEASETLARRTTRSVKYAPTYHLTFSLFTPSAYPSAWDVEPAIEQTFGPLLASLLPISNFTIDTQVQPYATFAPSVKPVYSETQAAWILQRNDLGGFINAAEWPLSPSIGAGPTINFILYVASASQSPLMIEGSDSNSWLVPQWGGVVVLNPLANDSRSAGSNPRSLTAADLEPVLLTFSSQLLSLLGLPSTPKTSLPLRLSTLTRLRAASLFISASSTLGSLARLVSALPSISIPDLVAESISSTVLHLEAACVDFRAGEFQRALSNARIAEQEAEKAFFERSMVGQVYFPEEHKIAVYLPLLGPMAVPLLMSAIKELKALRGSRHTIKTKTS